MNDIEGKDKKTEQKIRENQPNPLNPRSNQTQSNQTKKTVKAKLTRF